MDEELLLEDVTFDEDMFGEFDDDDDEFEYAEYDDDDDDEGFEFAEYDDDDDEDAEFLGAFIPPIAGALAGSAAKAIGGLFSNPRPSYPRRRSPRRYRRMRSLPRTRGVKHAVLRTPNGSAKLKLPATVVRRSDFLRTTADLRKGINKNTNRLNSTRKLVDSTRLQATQATALATTNSREILKTKKSLRRAQKAQSSAIKKMKAEQSQQAMMNMMMNMMSQRQLKDDLDDHTHPFKGLAEGGDGATSSASSKSSSSDNSAMMLLPMMMSQGGGSGMNDMMMPMMMMAMMNNDD